MANYEDLAEKIIRDELKRKNSNKRKRIKVSGKSVFTLQEIIKRGARDKK